MPRVHCGTLHFYMQEQEIVKEFSDDAIDRRTMVAADLEESVREGTAVCIGSGRFEHH